MGEWGAFETWYVREHARLLASMTLLAGDVSVAQEVTDEAFARAAASWSRVSAMVAPGAWTYRVACNLLHRGHRRRALERRAAVAVSRDSFEVPSEAVDLWETVRALPERQRLAVVLRYVADLPEARVAEVMGVTRGTVAATLAAARARLGRFLAEPCDREASHE